MLSSGVAALLDDEIPAGGVKLACVQQPAPLNKVGTGLEVLWNSPASTAWSGVAYLIRGAQGLVWDMGDESLLGIEQVSLGWIRGCWYQLQVNVDFLNTILLGMVLSRPADTHPLTWCGPCLLLPFTTVCWVLGRWPCLILALLITLLCIGASWVVLAKSTLIVVARIFIHQTERKLGLDGVSAGPTMARSSLCSKHVGFAVISGAPVNAIGPRVGFDLRVGESNGHRSNQSAEESGTHVDDVSGRVERVLLL